MPKIAHSYADLTGNAVALVMGIESARSDLSVQAARAHLPIPRVELTYELAYLRAFTAWEDFLEQSFIRYLCGYRAGHGQENVTSGSYCSNLSDARNTLYSGAQFLLWHNTQRVVARAQRHFTLSRCETVLSSMQGRLEHYSAVRHRIAHVHADANFDSATMALAGRRYRGSRPGRFLRDWAPHTVQPTRWLEVILNDYRSLAFQIVPS